MWCQHEAITIETAKAQHEDCMAIVLDNTHECFREIRKRYALEAK